MSSKDKVIALLHTSHNLLKPRHHFFGGQDYINFRDTFLRSSDIQLIDAKGACGSYVHVLGRLLQRANFHVRIAQMKCGNIWGCHILVETKVDGKWVILDALYDLVFEKEDGSLASFEEVGKDWETFKYRVPDNYNMSYSYEDVRYTNWQKVPILMPGVKEVLRFFMGDKVETFSIRSYVLNVYKVYTFGGIIVYFALIVITILVVRNSSSVKESTIARI